MLSKELFANPSSEFRPIPFWFWNSKLRPGEIENQIRDFRARGLGGFFIHARFGLETAYLSEEWMECVRHAVRVAEELGMEVWLYDENAFPSGIGDLKVSRVREFRSKFVELVEGDRPENAVFQFSTIEDPNDVVYGVDYLNPQAMSAFFDIALTPYERALGEHFGKTIKGVFTDEPTLLPWHHDICWYGLRTDTRVVVWDERIEPEMIHRRGMRASEFLPHLFFDVDVSTPDVRRAFWGCVRDLYLKAFFEPYRKWCDEHSLKLTGHVLFEEGLYINTDFQSDITALLATMHIPGTDHLGEVTETPYGGFCNVPTHLTNLQGEKLVASVAHCAGLNTVISETFGCAGWGLSFEKMKWIVDWQYSLGINMLCPHAVFYSIEGFRKSDAPPSENHMTGWRHYRRFADYVGRLSYVLRQGKHVAKVALFYPLAEFWGKHAVGGIGAEDRAISDAFDLCASQLCRLHFDYDIVSEQALAGARVEDGRLVIGDESYDVLIASESALYGDAARVCGELRHRINPPPASTEDDRAQFGGRLEAALRKLVSPDVEIESPAGGPLPDVRYVHRRIGSQDAYFIANVSGEAIDARIAMETVGRVESWNPETGEVSATVGVEIREGRLFVSVNLPPYGSKLFVVDESEPAVPAPSAKAEREVVLEFPDEWAFRIEGPNALILPELAFRPVVHGAGEDFIYSTSFRCEHVPKALLLMLDDVEYRGSLMGGMHLVVEVNGSVRDKPDFGWHLDKGFKTLDIASAVKTGENRLTIAIKHSAWSGPPQVLTSAPVLLGEFACEKDGCVILPPVVTARSGSWAEFGYPFYSGAAAYSQVFVLPEGARAGRLLLSVDGVRDMVEVEVNGRTAAVRLWQPWEAEITDLIRDGQNELSVKVTNSMANFLEASPRESGLMGRVRLIRCAG